LYFAAKFAKKRINRKLGVLERASIYSVNHQDLPVNTSLTWGIIESEELFEGEN